MSTNVYCNTCHIIRQFFVCRCGSRTDVPSGRRGKRQRTCSALLAPSCPLPDSRPSAACRTDSAASRTPDGRECRRCLKCLKCRCKCRCHRWRALGCPSLLPSGPVRVWVLNRCPRPCRAIIHPCPNSAMATPWLYRTEWMVPLPALVCTPRRIAWRHHATHRFQTAKEVPP